MTVSVQINGTALFPQPAAVMWESAIIAGKLDGSEAIGIYEAVTLTAPVETGGTAQWNWSTFENQVLTSIVLPERFETMLEASGTTYNSGVVARRIKRQEGPPGGLVRGVELQVLVAV
jgi:hypothetical protein